MFLAKRERLPGLHPQLKKCCFTPSRVHQREELHDSFTTHPALNADTAEVVFTQPTSMLSTEFLQGGVGAV